MQPTSPSPRSKPGRGSSPLPRREGGVARATVICDQRHEETPAIPLVASGHRMTQRSDTSNIQRRTSGEHMHRLKSGPSCTLSCWIYSHGNWKLSITIPLRALSKYDSVLGDVYGGRRRSYWPITLRRIVAYLWVAFRNLVAQSNECKDRKIGPNSWIF